MKNNDYIRAAALAAISLATAGSLQAAGVVDGSGGLDLGAVDLGRIYNVLTIPVNSVDGATWLTEGYTGLVAPVGQFTGVKADGSPLLPQDLIPLKPASITLGGETIVDWTDLNTIINPGGGATGPTGPTGPAFSEIIQIQGVGVQYASAVGQNLIFGEALNTLESPSNLYAFTADTVTLQPGHTYKLTFTVPGAYGGAQGSVGYGFYNVTSAAYFGPKAFFNSGVPGSLSPMAFLTPTVATTVAVKIDYADPNNPVSFGHVGPGLEPYLTVETVR